MCAVHPCMIIIQTLVLVSLRNNTFRRACLFGYVLASLEWAHTFLCTSDRIQKENKNKKYIHKKLNKYMEDGWCPT